NFTRDFTPMKLDNRPLRGIGYTVAAKSPQADIEDNNSITEIMCNEKEQKSIRLQRNGNSRHYKNRRLTGLGDPRIEPTQQVPKQPPRRARRHHTAAHLIADGDHGNPGLSPRIEEILDVGMDRSGISRIPHVVKVESCSEPGPEAVDE